MLINYNKFKFKTFKYPKSIILKIDNFLDKKFLKNVSKEIISLSNIKVFKKLSGFECGIQKNTRL